MSRLFKLPIFAAQLLLINWLLCSVPVEGQVENKWVASWIASPQGPYPAGFPVAQPDLRFAFPVLSSGATDQHSNRRRLIARRMLKKSRSIAAPAYFMKHARPNVD